MKGKGFVRVRVSNYQCPHAVSCKHCHKQNSDVIEDTVNYYLFT